MEVARGVLCQSARRVQGDVQPFVFVMVGERDANTKGVEKVLRAVLISARLMEEGRDATGVSLVPNLARAMYLATRLHGVRAGSAHRMVPWFRTIGFMVVQL